MHNNTPFGAFTRATTRMTCALATGLVLLQALAPPASGYEAAQTLRASTFLPAALRSGAHFRVNDKVANDGYVNTYHLTSKFGTFPAVSTAMVGKRIEEVNALVVMEHVEGTTDSRCDKESRVECGGQRAQSGRPPRGDRRGCSRRAGDRVPPGECQLDETQAQRCRGEPRQRCDRLCADEARLRVPLRGRCVFGQESPAGAVQRNRLGRRWREHDLIGGAGSGAGRCGGGGVCRDDHPLLERRLPYHARLSTCAA